MSLYNRYHCVYVVVIRMMLQDIIMKSQDDASRHQQGVKCQGGPTEHCFHGVNINMV